MNLSRASETEPEASATAQHSVVADASGSDRRNGPTMTPEQLNLQSITRRHFFGQCRVGLGSLALASLLSDGKLADAQQPRVANPLALRPTHFAPKAKNVIFLFMAGGPS